MAKLRDLLNVKKPEDIEGAAGPIDGSQILGQVTCYDECENNYHNNCCMSFIVPPNVTCAIFEAWGGGGGGSGQCNCEDECCHDGNPGSAGAYVVRCLNNLTEGACYPFIVGNATGCSYGYTGCRGCFSCVCGPNVEICAQGGYGACTLQNECGTVAGSSCAVAYGGDINIPGLISCGLICCYNGDYQAPMYNKYAWAYPGGINNLCGGHVIVHGVCGTDTGSWQPHCRQKCWIAEVLTGVGGEGMCWGYVPGLPNGPSHQSCSDCACTGCGSPGSPGMVKITYK